MCKSLLKELRFEIGEQYELNEFNLKSIKSTFSNGLEYDNYEYIKDDFKAFCGFEFSNNIILQYNGDILCSVIYEFEIIHFEELSIIVSQNYFEDIIIEVLKKDNNYCQMIVKSNK